MFSRTNFNVHQRFSLSVENVHKRLTRDGTAEPVSRDRILPGAEGGTGEKFIFPAQLTTSRIGNLSFTRLIHDLSDDNAYT